MHKPLSSRISLFICLLLVTLSSPPALAAGGEQQLRKFFGNLRGFSADFSQTVRNTSGKILQQSTGSVVLQRPLKFRWEYQSPYEQLIITDGKRLWIYDRDLQQLTIKSLNSSISNTPAALLSSGQALEKAFKIQEEAQRAGLAWVRLTPRKPDSGFEFIRLGFTGGILRLMVLTDSFGQTSTIQFKHLQKNIKPAQKQFTFSPPPGTDIIRDAEEQP